MRKHTSLALLCAGGTAVAAIAAATSTGAFATQHSGGTQHAGLGLASTRAAVVRAIAHGAVPQQRAVHPHAAYRANTADATPKATVVLGGLDNPRGLVVRSSGSVFITEAGAGGPTCFSGGEESDETCWGYTGKITKLKHGGAVSTFVGHLVSLAGPDGSFATGIDDVAAAPNYNLDFIATSTNGQSLEPQADAQIGNLLRAKYHGQLHTLGDVDAVEFAADVDGQGIDSDPYGVAEANGYQVVADAAGNDILKVQNGTVTVLAVFPNVPFVDPDGNQQKAQAVPTRVVRGPDGNFYVGLLGAGAPGAASVWKVTPQGVMSQVATGFTMITGLAFDKHGNMYVGEMLKGGFPQLDQGDFTGALIQVRPNGSRHEIAAGQLDAIGGVATAPDNSVYVTTNSVFPGAGQLVHITGLS